MESEFLSEALQQLQCREVDLRRQISDEKILRDGVAEKLMEADARIVEMQARERDLRLNLAAAEQKNHRSEQSLTHLQKVLEECQRDNAVLRDAAQSSMKTLQLYKQEYKEGLQNCNAQLRLYANNYWIKRKLESTGEEETVNDKRTLVEGLTTSLQEAREVIRTLQQRNPAEKSNCITQTQGTQAAIWDLNEHETSDIEQAANLLQMEVDELQDSIGRLQPEDIIALLCEKVQAEKQLETWYDGVACGKCGEWVQGPATAADETLTDHPQEHFQEHPQEYSHGNYGQDLLAE